jgi:hypothetical protein
MKANAGEEKYYPQANGEMHYVYGENLDKYKKDPTNYGAQNETYIED